MACLSIVKIANLLNILYMHFLLQEEKHIKIQIRIFLGVWGGGVDGWVGEQGYWVNSIIRVLCSSYVDTCKFESSNLVYRVFTF